MCVLCVQTEAGRTPATEAPGSWRTSLRKAGSSVTLGSTSTSDAASEALKDPEAKLGMTRSASSPRLSSEADNKVKHADIQYAQTI